MKVKVHFYFGKGNLFDKLIRIWQSFPKYDEGSIYSHVEIEINGVTYTADSKRNKVVKLWYKHHNPESWDTFEIECHNVIEVINFLEKQIGKKYDFIGIFFAQILALPYDTPKSWFCSELVSATLRHCGINLKHYNSWYNPRRLYNELKGIVNG